MTPSPASSCQLRVKRVRSAIRRPLRQKQTLRALGLQRMNRVRLLPDTPSVRAMIDSVAHLVHVEVAHLVHVEVAHLVHVEVAHLVHVEKATNLP